MLHRITGSKKKAALHSAAAPIKDLRILEAFSLFIAFVLSLLSNYFENEILLFGALISILLCVLLYLKIKLQKDKLSGVGLI